MARTRTLAQLIAEVRDRADIEGATHITDPQITRYINQSGAALHAMLVEHCEDEFVESSSGLIGAPVDNTSEVTLDDDFYKLIAFHVVLSGRPIPLERWQWMEEPALFDPTASGPPHRYRLTGNKIRIFPAVPADTLGRFFYVPAFQNMVLDTDTLDGRDGWEEWVVWDAAIKCLVKEESDTREAVMERDQVLTRVKQQMKQRDFARPASVVDVERTAWPFPMPYGG